MVTLAFTVFEDDAERGYHFRQQPGTRRGPHW